MSNSYRERLLVDSEKELAEKIKKKGEPSLEIFKRFRKVQEHRLRIWHNAGGGGRETSRTRSDVTDILFRQLFNSVAQQVETKSGQRGKFVIAAFGGYGRREMNPFSDVDIMFIHPKSKLESETEEIIRQTLVALWDIGFKVGHSTRSIEQAIKQANADPLIKTSMLECRYLLGDREVFQQFKEAFEEKCVRGQEVEYLAWRISNQAETRVKFGGSVFMQEPNVKNGCGGLRDYQNLLWVAHFKARAASMSKLVEKKILRESERRRLEKGYDFLLRTRTEMHYINGRPTDSLTLQMQGKIATHFGYPQKSILRRCETFMRDYYQHARDIHLTTEAALERMQLRETSSRRSFLNFFKSRKRAERFDGMIAKDGKLFPESKDIFADDPYRMMRVFQHLQARQLDLSEELADLIRRRLRLVDRTFQYAVAAREVFLSILSRKGEVGRILRLMHDLGFLGKYIPEFGALTCLVQHEFFHRYTADEHTLVCVEKLDGVLLSEERKLGGYRKIFQNLEDSAMLYLALLLHDTGKASNEPHHEDASAVLAHKVARRLQLSPERRRTLLTLVNSHYTLSHTAQTRNLEDNSTVERFADIVRTRPILDSLMLVTLADGMGTSDQNWSDWKEGLVWTLYHKTAAFLKEGPSAFARQKIDRAQLRSTVEKKMPGHFADEIAAHFLYMPERYFNMFDASQIMAHLQAFREFFARIPDTEDTCLTPSLTWIPRPEQGHSEVWVCGWDRSRFMERIAGAFLSAQINILGADIFSRADNLAFDIFRVCDTNHQPVTEPRDIKRVSSRIQESMEHDDYDFSPLLKKDAKMRFYRLSQEVELPSRIIVENNSHPIYTLIEIHTPDRLGLLYDILRTLGKAGVKIELSRIATEMDVAMDSFYVTGSDGKKITSDLEIQRLQKLLRHVATRPVASA